MCPHPKGFPHLRSQSHRLSLPTVCCGCNEVCMKIQQCTCPTVKSPCSARARLPASQHSILRAEHSAGKNEHLMRMSKMNNVPQNAMWPQKNMTMWPDMQRHFICLFNEKSKEIIGKGLQRNTLTGGTWVAQSVQHPILAFSLGCDLRVLGPSPPSGFTLSAEVC